MGGNVAENLSNQSVPEAAARVAAVVNRLVNRIGSNAESKERLAEIEIPEELRDNLALFLRLERRVLSEYDPEIADLFDKILTAEIVANAGNPGTRAADESVDEQGVPTADEPTAVAFREVVDLIDSLPLDKQQVIVRAFTSFFHLANLSEENYRVAQLREREAGASTDTEVDPANELTVAYHQLVNEMGVEGANELLDKLEFHPVFTAHPTEARRKAVEGKIRRISNLLEERPRLGGSDLVENERHMLQEIDALVRTSPIALKKPTPVEEADTIIDIFDNTLFDVIPVIYRRFDDWVLGDKAGTVPPLCPAFFHPGSWIGSDRDGNPNVTAKVSREVAAKYFTHMVLKLEDKCRRIGRNLTLEATYSKPSAELINLWNHQVEMSTQYTARAELISEHEPHRAVMLVMADRLNATVRRITDTMYHSADEFLEDLRVVQRMAGGTLLVGDGVEFVVVVFHVGRKRLLAYDFGSGSQFGRARTRVADELFRGGSDGLARNDFERRFGLAEEILFDAPLEITAAQEVLHQPVFERVVGDHYQPSAGAQHLEALFQRHFERFHFSVYFDAQGLEQLGQEFRFVLFRGTGRYGRNQVCGGQDRLRGPCADDAGGDFPGGVDFAPIAQDAGQGIGVERVHQVGRRASSALIHPHVERC